MQAAGGGGGGGGGATVPRNFKLLDELDEAERSTKGGADVSLGLAQNDDSSLSYWNCSIFAQAGGGEPRMWSMSIYCDKDYPTKPPVIKFSSKVSMDCVDAKGNVRAAAAGVGAGRGAAARRGKARRGAARRGAERRRKRSAARRGAHCAPSRLCPQPLTPFPTPAATAGHQRQGAVPGVVEREQDAARRVPGPQEPHRARPAPAAAGRRELLGGGGGGGVARRKSAAAVRVLALRYTARRGASVCAARRGAP